VQITIFVVLMLLYFSITRNFYQMDIGRPYQNGVSLLNLSVTGLLMCAYTGRFIYPLLSLEGRKFWLLGLLPLKRDHLLWGKFVFSTAGILVPSVFLIVVSDLLLGLSPVAIGLHALTMLVLALGVSGLSVGLGAALPNFKETDPSKIAVGFGGTLNLILGLIFLVLVVGLIAAPYHLHAAGTSEQDWVEPWTAWWLYSGIVLGVALGMLAVMVPMHFGIQYLEKMEF
jgi:ABC-2 type transport system permease protein